MLLKLRQALLALLLLTLAAPARADEGMWLPLLLKQLNEADMQRKGLKLTADQIYSINQGSLKDAVVQFGGGCTGEIISNEGLLLTNHHCGYGQIQQHSSVENDYLTKGYWAMNRSQELTNPGLTATFIIRMEDVTGQVLAGVPTANIAEADREKLVQTNIQRISQAAVQGTHYQTFIRPFYNGNEYYMFVTEVFQDIRLVGAPPSSIGKFGGDTDNWAWPRHTGDFSIFRIYAGPDNKPAPYSAQNVPFKPRHHLPISLAGVQPGDFTLVFGFPGRTNEYLTSWGVDEVCSVSNPAKIKVRDARLQVLDADMKASDKVRIQYAAKYAGIANYWKKWIGENRGLKKLDAVRVKQEQEVQFQQWAASGDDARRAAYAADITYGTNNEFGFDYLRDNMARETGELVQRKHHYAMVDEVDSVLIDDARTPLIISGPVPRGDVHEFYQLKPRIQRLVDEQKKLVQQYLVEARKGIKDGNDGHKDGEAGLALFRAYRGLPKSKPLIKFLSETGMRAVLQKVENHYLQDNSRQMPQADMPLFFTIDEKNNQIELTEKGIDLITAQGEDPHLFIMPDIGSEIATIELSTTLKDDEKLHTKEKLMQDYQEKSERVHTVNQLLKAYTLFEKDDQYILTDDGKVKIVDEQTGRVMEGRRYSDGLHQAIEAKENVRVEDATQTYATVTLQNYFRMYHKLGGMTGTAETEAGEFWDIYKLDVVVIPTNRGIQRQDEHDKVYKTVREKYNAVAEEIQTLVQAGRPVLVGTTSVEISELVSRMLKLRGIQHQVLNAKQNQREAEIVAGAGFPGTVTIATNMAGRGTDIKLRETSKDSGGLAIIGTERHESRRVDRQLRGRAGRQGDPGSSQFFVSLEDNLMRLFGSDRIAKLMDRMGLEEGEVIQHSMITSSIERAQKKVEENNFGQRKRLLEYDDVMNAQREVVYKRRRNALFGERLELDVWNMIYDVAEDIVASHKISGDYEDFKLAVIRVYGYDTYITEAEMKGMAAGTLSQKLYDEALGYYHSKNDHIAGNAMPLVNSLLAQNAPFENVAVPFTDGRKQVSAVASLLRSQATAGHEIIRSMEKSVVLSVIDTAWTQHLRQMDDLKQVVQNAVYEQKDPLLVYKFESFELFKGMIGKVNEDTLAFLFRADIPVQGGAQGTDEAEFYIEDELPTPAPLPKLKAEKEVSSVSLGAGPEDIGPDDAPVVKQQPVRSQKVANRNEKVTVQYMDGRIVSDVKYKTVEDDLLHNRCVLVGEA